MLTVHDLLKQCLKRTFILLTNYILFQKPTFKEGREVNGLKTEGTVQKKRMKTSYFIL